MYDKHEGGNGGGSGKPEYMKIEFGMALLPMLRFKGGCSVCQDTARGLLNMLCMVAMSQAAAEFKVVLEKNRGECSIEVVSPEDMERMMREKLGDEVTNKIMEFAK